MHEPARDEIIIRERPPELLRCQTCGRIYAGACSYCTKPPAPAYVPPSSGWGRW